METSESGAPGAVQVAGPGARRFSSVTVTGRFQPFHNDHLDLVRIALTLGERVIVAITNPGTGQQMRFKSSTHRHLPSSNPFTFDERRDMIDAALGGAGVDSNRFRIIQFPLEEPDSWLDRVPADSVQLVRAYSPWERDKAVRFEAAGYAVELLEGDSDSKVSASDIREAMRNGAPWRHWVPPGAVRELERIGDDRLRRRCA